jgi:hypothetical protein
VSVAPELDDATRLRWLQEAASAVARGHAIEADELLSEMVESLLAAGSLHKISNKGNAWQRARWCLATWIRRRKASSPRRGGRTLKALEGTTHEERQRRWKAEQPVHAEPEEPSRPVDQAPQMQDLHSLDVWRRLFEREHSRKLGVPVRLGDRRVKDLLRQRAMQIRHEAPELGLELLEIASAPTVLCARQGPRSRGAA